MKPSPAPPRAAPASLSDLYDVLVVGGGPAGATAAADLARRGRSVLLLDRAGRIKPCGGAIPPRLLQDFDVPESLVVARASAARIVAPSGRSVDMPVEKGHVALVDRETFDEWLRERAAQEGADRRTGVFLGLAENSDGTVTVTYRPEAGAASSATARARIVLGADGARSAVGRAAIAGSDRTPFVFAYHEVVETGASSAPNYDPTRCDIYYHGRFSPDFYAWIFPHGGTASIGTGSARKGFGLRPSVDALRQHTGLAGCRTLRREGAPIPLRPLRRWDNGRNVVLAGDAAGVVAPASGEGIYYAMASARMVADAVEAALATGEPRALATARRRFMADHGRVFLVLRMMQGVWYRSDWLRERFVSLCADEDIQRLTWAAYLEKRLVRTDPLAHLRIAVKDMAHLLGLSAPWSRRA
jgi:geranylgeranyl reductase